MYRKIDFSRKLMDTWGEVERIEYDPNRSAFIALIKYKPNSEILAEIIKGKNSWSSYYCNVKNGIVYAYILATKNMRVGDRVISCEYFSVDHPEGSCLPLAYIPIGKFVHNIQTSPGSKNFFVRGAGCAAIIVGKAGGYVNVKLPSGTTMRIQDSCKATMGCVSNENHNQIKLGSAGANRRRGRKPTVRGHAMNPVDHKMGGRKSGQIIQTNWRGHMKKGQKTRRKKKSSDHIISGRRKRNA
jgi:large subunit ribosomal protein L2